MISAGEFVQASGGWVSDRTHGVQFRPSFLKATTPTTVEGIEKYLGSGMIRGIGPVYAKKLVRAFGETVFDVIQQQPPITRNQVELMGKDNIPEPDALGFEALQISPQAIENILPQMLQAAREKAEA
jgi:hypothetical protein